MTTIHLSEGCTLTCSARFAERLREENAEVGAEKALRVALRRARAEALASGSPEAWDYYSDLHKEVYGVRPR